MSTTSGPDIETARCLAALAQGGKLVALHVQTLTQRIEALEATVVVLEATIATMQGQGGTK